MMSDINLPAPGGLQRSPTADNELDSEEEAGYDPDFGELLDEGHPHTVDRKYDQDIADARGFCQDIVKDKAGRSNKIKEFVATKYTEWNKRTSENRNFLHCLAHYEYDSRPTVSLQLFMAHVIKKMPKLLGETDSTLRTPLNIAFSKGNWMFIFAVFSNVWQQIQGQFNLESECESTGHSTDRTCLHTALRYKFDNFGPKFTTTREDIIKKLCEIAPKKMFTITDNQDRTPLHIAVDYEHCSAAQVVIVSELLRLGPEAINVEIQRQETFPMRGIPNVHIISQRSSISVYQYHQQSRKQAMAKAKAQEHRTKPTQGSYIEVLDGESQPSNPKIDPKRDFIPSGTGRMEPARDKVELLGQSYQRRVSVQNSVAPSETPITAVNPEEEANNRPGNPPKVSTQTTGTKLTQKAEEREEASSRIREKLKHLYLRNKLPDEASRCLHVPDEKDKELWFDFGPAKNISKRDFERHFKYLEFDSILQYVAFPEVKLDEDEDTSHACSRGRRDMVFFFEWLKGKKVKKILKVIVEDSKASPHSDEAIEEALEYFNIEELDWRRLDLDPVSLKKIGGSLKTVHLQWSGSNPVLRSWSEPEGLATIPTLEEINITQFEGTGLERGERIRENLEEFEKRLSLSWPTNRDKPRVTLPEPIITNLQVQTPATEAQPSQRQERPVDPHRWMQCMDEFASHFKQLHDLRKTPADPDLCPVEVALIDDGVDITHPALRGLKTKGKTFHLYQEGKDPTWRVSPYWSSTSGHGTLMARLIHRICPSAIIHVIKLQTYTADNSEKFQINPDSAIKAIKYAAEQGVHIIATSWTIKPPELAKKIDFNDVLHDALNKKGILMFCAASDQGQYADVTYPYAGNHNSFRIGAAKATGTALETVGDAHTLNFILPGHEVVFRDEFGDEPGKDHTAFEAHTGSSVATALAAGLAALIIECVRLGVIYAKGVSSTEASPADTDEMLAKDDLVAIRGRESMRYALESINNRNTGGKYIEVWDKFSHATERLKQAEGVRWQQLAFIHNLAKHFLKKGL